MRPIGTTESDFERDLISNHYFERGTTMGSASPQDVPDACATCTSSGFAWRHQARWTAMTIRNIAYSGFFSADRTVADYLARIWRAEAVSVPHEPGRSALPDRRRDAQSEKERH
ncbi:glycogen/starch/alpha-glucan phosphorylase [Actinoplanes sp. NPDC049265]|uniref:glycogen/starch/alpha-glucan phosphorylase n=1 Tax=Actinoplanes sp. NPDC049265 TaxID=3363902 RepID=UPI00371ED27A